MTEQNIETTGFAPAPPVPPQVPVTPPPAPFPIPKTAPSSKNSVRARAPGWQFQQGKQFTPADARAIIESRVHDETKIYKPGTKRGTQLGFASNTVQGSASIVEQARALKNDPQLIYEFVYNNIEWEPGFSQQKGSLGCLLDGMGNSFDQSDLLVKLLRQAGFTANYVLGTIQLTEAELMAWFGTSDIWGSAAYCGNENIPYQSPVWNGTGWDMVLSHMWVEVVISGTTYVMDPSRKTYSRTAPVSGLDTIIGYTPATFLSNAQSGATVTADYVQNMNTANINSDLTSMTSNLTTWIKANKPDATVDDILGGQSIVPVTLPITFATSLSYQTPGDVPTIWTGNIPLAYQTTLQVQFPDNSGGWCIDETFTSDQLAGTRLTLTYNGSLQPVLKLDGVTIATGIAQGSGTWNSILLTVTHNGYPVNWYDQQWWQSFIYAGAHYLIGNAWGNLGRGQALLHTKRLAANKASGAAVTDEPVMGEELALVWFHWASQASRVSDLVNRIMNCHSMVNHQVGIVSFDSGGVGAFALDIGGVNGSSTNLNNDVTKTPINDTVSAMHGVALEAAVLAQTTGLTPGISTTAVIHAANAGGSKIYKGTTANWNTGSNISAALVTAGYLSSDMNDIYGYLQVGYTAMLADDPTVTLGVWTGWGDFLFPNSGAFGLINGSYKGGGGQPGGPGLVPSGSSGSNPGDNQGGQLNNNDPIGVFSGEFFYNRTDIRLGSQRFPYGLSFARTYGSSAQYTKGSLGWGWTHNHDITAKITSDGLLAMANQFALQGTSSIVELFVSTDLLADTARPVNKLVTVNLSNSWWIDQIVNNVVILSFPKGKHVFIKQPSGLYTSPATFPGTLSLVTGLFTFTTPTGLQYHFNSSGQITSCVNPAGVTVSYSYTSGLLSTISNGLGRTLTLHYSGNLLTSVTDGTGRTISYGYDVNDDLVSFTDANLAIFTHVYDQPGRMTQYFRPANPLTAYCTNVYDSLSRVMTQSNSLGQQWTYYFGGSRTEIIDPLFGKDIMYLGKFGGVLQHIDALGYENKNAFDGLNRIIEKTLPEGNKMLWTYDEFNNILTKTFVPKIGSGLSNIQISGTYDPIWHKLSTMTDGMGNITTHTYDAVTGNLLTTVKPMVGGLSPTITRTYNARGQLLSSEDETGLVHKYTYDVTTEKLTSKIVDYSVAVGHLNLTTIYGHDGVGNLTSVTDPNGNVSTMTFDAERRMVQWIKPTPFSYLTKWTYDPNGNPLTIEKQLTSTPTYQLTTTTYTLTDKIHTITDPAGNVILMSYDGKDRLQTVTDPESRVRQINYDALDRLSTLIDPAGITFDTSTYSANGLLASRTDARSNITQYSRDGLDRLDKTTYADGTFEQNSSYDANGNVLIVVTRSGATITCTYDALNRWTSRAPGGQPMVTMGYDLAGRLTSIAKPVVAGDPSSGALQFYFDTAGRFYKEQYPDGKTVVHELDANENRTKTIWPDGYFVQRSFDQLNRLTAIKLNGSPTDAVSLAYDQLSRRSSKIFSNGVITTYDFQPNDDLTGINHEFVGSSVALTYSYNLVHQAVSRNSSDSTFVWHPAAAGTTTYGVADNVNKYPTVNAVAYSYDGNKNLTGDGVWTFAYDTENHLLSANKTGVSASYLYDPMHRQSEKTVGSTKTRFVYDGNQRIADYDGTSGALITRYISGGFDEPLLEVTSGGVISFFHQDKQNSVIARTNASGAVIAQYNYSAFGECATLSATAFAFTGQRYDVETGLYYYKARMYSPVLGRFLQSDPVKYAGGTYLNLYDYVGNDPVNRLDPLGLTSTPDDPKSDPPPGDDQPTPPNNNPNDYPPDDPLPPNQPPDDRGDENKGTNDVRVQLEKILRDIFTDIEESLRKLLGKDFHLAMPDFSSLNPPNDHCHLVVSPPNPFGGWAMIPFWPPEIQQALLRPSMYWADDVTGAPC